MADETLPPIVAQLLGDASDLIAELDDVMGKLRDFSAGNYTADLAIADTAATTNIDHVNSLLDQYGNTIKSATLGIDDADASAKFDDINAKLDHWGEENAKASVDLGGFDETIAKIDAINAKLDETGAKDEHPKIDVNSSGATEGLGLLLSAILALGPAAVAVVGIIGGAFAALPGIFGGLSAGIGALGLGLSGITSAFSSSGQAAGGAGSSYASTALQALQAAQSMSSAAEAVRSSEEALANTQTTSAANIISAKQAVTAAITSTANAQIAVNNQIRNSQQSLASATQAVDNAQIQAANSVHSAQEQLSSSEQQYSTALYNEQQAQLAVVAARQAAANQLTNYNDQLADGALQAQQDQLNLIQAKDNLVTLQNTPGSSSLQIAQAQLAVQQATQAIKDQSDQYSQLQQSASAAQSQGVDGATSVLAAQQNLAAATQATSNAQQAQSDAQNALSQAQVTAIQTVQTAEQNLANTQLSNLQGQRTATVGLENAQKSQEQAVSKLAATEKASAQSVADAQRSVTQAIKAQQVAIQEAALQAQVSASSGGGSAASPFSALTASGKQFVTFIKSNLIPVFDQLKSKDQAILLPGLESAIITLMPAIQAIEPFILNAAKGIGQFANSLADFASSATGLGQIKAIFSEGNGFMKDLGNATLSVIKGMGNLGVLAGPIVKDIGEGAERAANAFDKWTVDGSAGKFLQYVEKSGPALMKALGAIVGDFVAWGKAMAPLSGPLLTIIANVANMVGSFMSAHPAITSVVTEGIGLFGILSKLTGVTKAMITIFNDGIIPAMKLFGVTMEGLELSNPILLAITVGIAAIAAIVYEVYEHWSGFVNFFEGLWHDIQDVFDDAIKFIESHLSIFAAAIGTIMLGPIGLLVAEIATHWNTVKTDAKTAWDDILNFFKGIGTSIENTFTGALSWLEHLGEDIINGLWDGIKTVWKDVTTWFGSVATFAHDAIFQKVGAAETWLLDIGKNILEGLLNGMKNGWNDATGWLGGIADKLKKFITNPLSIFSPSRVMMEIGNNIMLGLHQGLQQGWESQVSPLMKQIGNNLSVGFNGGSLGVGGISPVSTANAGSGTTVLQVTTPIQVNGQTLASTVTTYQLRSARSTGTALGQYAGGSQTGAATFISPNAISR